jgi:archaetidylinositol phosphate synthase
MIDARGRQKFDPIFEKLAARLISWGLKPNQVTLIALAIGFAAGLVLYFEQYVWAVILLWLSGLFDVLDGQMARRLGQASMWGALVDIVSDRLVELFIIWGLALRRPDCLIALLFLTSCILISMTVFLTTGLYAEKLRQKGTLHTTKSVPEEASGTKQRPKLTADGKALEGVVKSFYYQAGLMERTEGFIAFSCLMLFPGQLALLTWIYAGLIVFTIGQRLAEAHRLFRLAGAAGLD